MHVSTKNLNFTQRLNSNYLVTRIQKQKTYPGGTRKEPYGTSIPAVGSERAPRRSKFKVFLLLISGTRSAGMLVAWQVIFIPLLPLPVICVLVGFTRRAIEGHEIPLFPEHS